MATTRGTKASAKEVPHPFALYTAAVQVVEADIAFMRRVYRRHNDRHAVRLREDFCGTARLACEWARMRRGHEAWGVDLDLPTLVWGDEHHRRPLGAAADRVHLLHDDVLTVRTPPVDVIVALNFSYFIFKERAVLRRYLKHARAALRPGGMLALDIYGGTTAMVAIREKRTVRGGRDPRGTPLPPFRFIWEQERFDAFSHQILCHIHFDVKSGPRLHRSFTYDWRLWTVPEMRELLAEAGFAKSEVYTHGWLDNGDSDGIYRRRERLENHAGWLAYVIGYR